MRGNDPETALPGGGSAQFVCVVIVVLAVAGAVAGADWPRWRGPAGDGTTPEPTGWRKGARLPKTPAWTFNAGEGCSSPVVAGGRIYATGWREHRDTLYCLDAATGREIWRQSGLSPR